MPADSSQATRAVTLVIPAYNEEAGIERTLAQARAVLDPLGGDYEIIVVDDGSTDQTRALAESAGVRVVVQPENRGYGAALKAGIATASHECIVISDADGTYPADAIPKLLEYADDYEMVVGARTGAEVSVPLMRRPAKAILRVLASYLAGRKIPDLNSGLRVLRRETVRRLEHILPSGFSFTTTITLALLCDDRSVYYYPINYYERVGDSKIRPTHALEFLILILRAIVYFNPLKVFLPLGGFFFLFGLLKLSYDVLIGAAGAPPWISESAVLSFIGAALVWSLGLLADQNARLGLRRLG